MPSNLSLGRLSSFAVVVLLAATALAAPPKLVRSEPAEGATDVPLDFGVIRLVFDQDMRTDSYTCWKSPDGEFLPAVKEGGATWLDARTFELKIEKLKPDTRYAVQLNSDQRQGFVAADGQPLPTATIRFKTAATEREARKDIYDPSGEEKPEAKNRPTRDADESKAERKPKGEGVSLRWNAKAGQVSKMTQITRVKMNVTVSGGEEQRTRAVDQLFKLQYREKFLEAAAGRPVRVNRKIELAQASAKDPDSGDVQRQDLPLAGVDCDLRINTDGSMELVKVRAGAESVAEEMAGESGFVSLEPDKPVKIGDTWKLTGKQLEAALKGLDASEGEITLKLAKIEKDPKIEKDVATIEGAIRVRMELPEGLVADMEGTLKEEFIPEIGLPFLRHVKGSLRINQTLEQEGQRVKIRGEGSVEMVEERALLDEEAGEREDDPAAKTPKAPERGRGPVEDESDEGRTEATRSPDEGRRTPGASTGTGDRGVYLTLFRDPAQGAFFMLVPKDWKTDGGMYPSGVEWNVVDLIESNIRFRVTCPDGGSFFGFYPRFYFMDPQTYVQNSGGYLNPQPGGMMNGCWLYGYMEFRQFIETIVFKQFAPQEFVDPRIIGNFVSVPELRGFVPQVAQHAQHGYVEFESTIKGVPSRGRLYAILASYGSGMWTNIGTWGLVAPKSRWSRDERIMEYCLRTFRFNPEWVKRASAAAAERGRKFYETNRDLNEAYEQMGKQRAQRNSNIQEEMYKVLTGQIETRDPQTGEAKWLPSYNRAFSNGRGDYFLTDYTGSVGLENNSDWRELEVVNRNR